MVLLVIVNIVVALICSLGEKVITELGAHL